MNVEGSEFLPQNLWLIDIPEVVTPPDEEQHFHVEDDEEDDVGQGRQDKKEIAALCTISCTSEPIMYWMWFIV